MLVAALAQRFGPLSALPAVVTAGVRFGGDGIGAGAAALGSRVEGPFAPAVPARPQGPLSALAASACRTQRLRGAPAGAAERAGTRAPGAAARFGAQPA